MMDMHLAELLRPALEALPLQGHDWHRLVLMVRRNVDGSLDLYSCELTIDFAELRRLRQRWDDESKGGIDPYEVDKFLDWLEAPK